jgi:hypothetical protein
MLLGELDADSLDSAIDVLTGERVPKQQFWASGQWEALLEPMVRALATDPERLDEIRRLVGELEATEAGTNLLPTGWKTVWDPIWQARQELSNT